MWIRKEKYKALKQLAKDNERDAETFRDMKRKLQTCSAIYFEDYVFVNPGIWRNISDEMAQLKEENKDLAAELEWYKVKYHEVKTGDQNDYYQGVRDFIEWLLTNDKYAACTIDTDEECIFCEVGLTEGRWTRSADELFKEFTGDKL